MATESLLVRLNMDATRYNTQARTAAANTAAVGTSAKTAGRATGGLGKKMKGLATSGGGLLAVAGGAFAVKQAFDGTVGAFASFDDAMTQSLAIMGDVSEEMRDEMSDAARTVARETTFSAEQAAEAYFFLASAGLDATQSVEAMPQVAQFAQAGMFDLATATDLATDAQSVLGLTSEDAGENLENLTRVTDVLVQANTQANATVEQFATSLTQKAGGALRSVEKDIEEGIAVLSVFADQGIKGERGGTILRATLDGLSNNARDNAEAFSELGISVFDSEENMRNMADITADIEDALGPMTVEAREAALAQLGFNKRSREGILALQGNSEAVREYEENLRDAGGTTEEVADKQLESAKKQFELFLSGLQDVGLEIGEELLPALQDMLPLLQGSADVVSSIDFSTVTSQAAPLIDALTLLSGLLGESGDEAEEAGVGSQILGAAWQSIIDFANPLGAAYREINELLDDSEESALEGAEGFSTLGGEMNQIPTVSDKVKIAMNENRDALYGARDAAMQSRPEVKKLAEAEGDLEFSTRRVEGAMRSLHDEMRAQTDPLFALERASRDAAEAQDAINVARQKFGEGSPEHLQAIADAAQANSDLKGAAIDVRDATNLTRDAFIEQQVQMGLSREDAILLADQFEALDDFSFDPKRITVIADMSAKDRALFGSAGMRQHGGPVSAHQPYVVGEAGPELFVPDQSGQVISNQTLSQQVTSNVDTDRLISALGGGRNFTANITALQAPDPSAIADAFAWKVRTAGV